MNGIAVYDELVKPTYDRDRDIEYPPFTSYNDENMNIRASKSALPVIYSIKANGLKFNHDVAMGLKSVINEKKMKLLINDIEGKDFLMDKMGFSKKSPEEQAYLLRPFIQTSIMINEMVNLEYEVKNGYIRVYETGRNRKDRYSSLAYANYLARLLEKEKLEEKLKSRGNKKAFVFW